MFQLMVSNEAATQLNKIADQTGKATNALAEQAIRQFVRAETRRLMRNEIEAYHAMYAELRAKFADQYVAIYQSKVVDRDADQLALLERIEAAYPNAPVFITQVQPQVEEVYTVRSPRWESEL